MSPKTHDEMIEEGVRWAKSLGYYPPKKCPKCGKYSTTHKAEVFVCNQCYDILNPEEILKFLKGLADKVPSLETDEYQNFLERIKNLIVTNKILRN